MTNEKCASCIHCEVCTFTESKTAKLESCDFYDDGKAFDKIRAEMENIAYDWQEIDGEHESRMVVDLNDALEIIDKYKAESEVDG